MDENEKFYTVVFKGDVRSMGGNLFKIVSPFGDVVSICVGDALEQLDDLRDKLEEQEAGYA